MFDFKIQNNTNNFKPREFRCTFHFKLLFRFIKMFSIRMHLPTSAPGSFNRCLIVYNENNLKILITKALAIISLRHEQIKNSTTKYLNIFTYVH